MAIIPLKWARTPARRYDNPFEAMEREVNQLLGGFFNNMDQGLRRGAEGTFPTTWSKTFNPDIDLVEGDKEYTITAELPGLTEKDVEVSWNQDTLSIKGEKKFEHEEKDKNFRRLERSYGAFHREILLPTEVDDSKLEATFKNGVLKIVLPKSQSAVKDAKKISIKTS